MTRKPVDPVHFFDHLGFSVLSNRHVLARNEELEKENERLRDIIRRLQARMRHLDGQPKPKNH